MKYLIMILLFYTLKSSFADTLDNHEISFNLNKHTFVEGEDIILKIKFDFNKRDSTIYYSPHFIISDVVVLDDQVNKHRPYEYLITLEHYDSIKNVITLGNFIYPRDSILPQQIKTLKLEINRDFSTEDTYWTKDIYMKEYLLPGSYTVKFDANESFYWLNRRITSNELKFKVLPKTK